MILKKEFFKHYIDNFNKYDQELTEQYINNEMSWNWLEENIPFFECPDQKMEEIYYFRWWTYRKHIKSTKEGFIITEFLPEVPWSGEYNAITCSIGHHSYEGRWLHDHKYLHDYFLFWLRGSGNPHLYSTWLADSILKTLMISDDYELADILLEDLVNNYYSWEKSNLHASGLFWSIDDRDAMEYSISGNGIRPTLNSYMYADAKAISCIARKIANEQIAEIFDKKADSLKDLVQKYLWDPADNFFKVFPLSTKSDSIENWSFDSIQKDNNVRELIGFIPWYFNLPSAGYEVAWQQLMDSDGFYAPYGPTTAEQRHFRFMFENAHECLWNGPSWPYATSQTLVGLANLLNNYQQSYINREHYFKLLKNYTCSHYLAEAGDKVVPWIDENLDPYSGDWTSRSILKEMGWPIDKGGLERGKDYNHSSYCDLIISGLLGLRPRNDEIIEINPLVPENKWDYFCLDDIHYHTRKISIIYDRTGKYYNMGKGLQLFVNNEKVAQRDNIGKITVDLDC